MSRIWYLYDDTGKVAPRNAHAPQLVSSIVKALGLKPEYIRMLHMRDWDRFLVSQPEGILISPMVSSVTQRLRKDIDSRGLSLFMINTYSTAHAPELEGTDVLRMLPEDNVNAYVYASIVAEQPCDRVLILYDSQDIWATSLARLIIPMLRNKGKDRIQTMDVRNPKPAPMDMPTCIIALTVDAIARLRPILGRGSQNIVGTLLGDTSISLVPTTQEELSLLQAWKASVLSPSMVQIPDDLHSRILSLYGLGDTTALLGVTVSAIQIAYYLLLSVNMEAWGDSPLIVGSEADMVSIYALLTYTSVGQPATRGPHTYFVFSETSNRARSDTIPNTIFVPQSILDNHSNAVPS